MHFVRGFKLRPIFLFANCRKKPENSDQYCHESLYICPVNRGCPNWSYFIVVTCPEPPNPSNGHIQFQNGSLINGGYTISSLATFFCDHGYRRSSNFVQLLCRTTGMWSHPYPTGIESKKTNMVILTKEGFLLSFFDIIFRNCSSKIKMTIT